MRKLFNNDVIFSTENSFYEDDWMSKDYYGKKNWGTSFWDNSDNIDLITGKSKIASDSTYNLIKLSKYLKAISNFVKIMTNRDDISVNFASSQQSYTDGKSIVISADIEDGNFDATVGLALHESSHILKSDMSFFNSLAQFVNTNDVIIKKLMKKYNETDASKIKRFVMDRLRDLVNIIEDRRVDDFVYRTSPGYMVYYHALYKRYFINDITTKVLLSNSLRKENWKSYNFRINYLMNPAAIQTIDSLKNLKKIYDLIDIKNISRLTSVKDCFNLALEIFTIIENSVNPENLETKKPTDGAGNGNGESSEGNSKSTKGLSKDNNESTEKSSESNNEPTNDSSNTKSNEDLTSEEIEKNIDDIDYSSERYSRKKQSLADKELTIEISEDDLPEGVSYDDLVKIINDVKSFINGNPEKKSLNSGDVTSMRVIEQSNVCIKPVGGDKDIECILVKKLTKDLIESKQFKNIFTDKSYEMKENNRFIKNGIRRGVILGKQLKIRSEKRELKYTRLEHGKLDKHIIAELGYRDNNVFYKKTIDKFNDVYIHISVDASGSMCGDKWHSSLETVTAIAKAVSMINGIHLVISFRNTSYDSRERPFIIVAYDSKIDKFKKIELLFKYLNPGGFTPEGLTFEAIFDEFPKYSKDIDKYFVNFSDGLPCFRTFNSNDGIEETRKQVKKLINNDVNVISYYIESGYDTYGLDSFKRMYGNNANNIDLNSITQIANSLNKRFLIK